MRIHATYREIRRPAERLRRMLAAQGVPDDIAQACELALHELLTNLVDHAYQGDASRTITVNLACDSKSIRIETVDSGKPARIDLGRVVMPDPAELAEGGYGLALIRSLVDEVSYAPAPGRNVWRLRRAF